MANQKHSYLVSNSLKRYILASIITTAVTNLNTMIDGMLMGNFLGPDALAAVNLCMPVVNGMLALNTLFSSGGVMVAARAMGRMDKDQVYKIFSLCSGVVWLISLILMCVSGPVSAALAQMVCVGEKLVPLCQTYIMVLMLGALMLLYSSTLSMFIDVSGYPRIVTFGMSMSVVTNVAMDFVLVKFLRMDIGGAALASVLGNLISMLILGGAVIRKKNMLRLTPKALQSLKMLPELVLKSIPAVVGMVAVIILQMACNQNIQEPLGADGMFVLSVGYSLLGVSSMVSMGMNTAFTAIGGMLMGQQDYSGVRILFRRGITICAITGVVFLLLSCIIPRPLAMLFGAEEENLLQLAARGIPMIGTFILAMTVLLPMSTHYQVLGRFTLATLMSLSVIVTALISFFAVRRLAAPENVWYAFPLACVLCLMVLGIGSTIAKLQSKTKVSFLNLIPVTQDQPERYDLSVACSEKGVAEGMEELWNYLSVNGMDQMADRVSHTVEELLLNIVREPENTDRQFIDVLVRKDAEQLVALIKDAGTPFDTAAISENSDRVEMRVAHHYCKDIAYSYTFGQNITSMTWKL